MANVPQFRIEYMATDSLIPYARNAKVHTDEQVRQIADSMEAFGFNDPVGVWTRVDGKVEIVEGHGRVMAAKLLGIDKVPVIRLDHMTDDERRAYVHVHNQTTLSSGFDMEALKLDLDGIQIDTSPWFDGRDLSWAVGKEQVEETEVPEDVEPRAKRGDVWQLGRHRVMCGDSTSTEDVERLTGGVQPYAIITDPPYCSGGFQESGKKSGSIGTRDTLTIANDTLSTRGYMSLIKTVLEKAGDVAMAYIFTDWRMFVNLFDVCEAAGFGVRNMIVWDKVTPGMGVGWRSQHEICLFASRAAQKFNPHLAQGNVIQCGRTGNMNHPTEKPVELIAKIMRVTDMANDIYDPFGGSGTTLIAADQLGRTCYMMELDPHYVDVIIARWETLTGQTAELLNTSEPAAR